LINKRIAVKLYHSVS